MTWSSDPLALPLLRACGDARSSRRVFSATDCGLAVYINRNECAKINKSTIEYVFILINVEKISVYNALSILKLNLQDERDYLGCIQ